MLNIRFRERTNTWPGFVDLFSNLVIILIFLMLVFVFLWTTTNVFNHTSGARAIAELQRTNASQSLTINEITAAEQEAKQQLSLTRRELAVLEREHENLQRELDQIVEYADNQIAGYEQDIADLTTQLNQAIVDKDRTAALEAERRELQSEMTAQRAELTEQLSKLQSALDAAEEKSRTDEIRYVEMSSRLNRALADKVAELNTMSRYQSAFYKAISTALNGSATVREDGDRFIVSSDILFPSGSYTLSSAGQEQLRALAAVIKDFENEIPSDINWIIRIDGHTDKKPVIPGTRGYANNTELSLKRATAVADALAKNGVSKRRLVPSGFGDLHPVELGNDAASLQKNRRIELQLTNR